MFGMSHLDGFQHAEFRLRNVDFGPVYPAGILK